MSKFKEGERVLIKDTLSTAVVIAVFANNFYEIKKDGVNIYINEEKIRKTPINEFYENILIAKEYILKNDKLGLIKVAIGFTAGVLLTFIFNTK